MNDICDEDREAKSVLKKKKVRKISSELGNDEKAQVYKAQMRKGRVY